VPSLEVSQGEGGLEVSDMIELLEPTYKPSRNGHAVLAPYTHIEGISSLERGSQYIEYLPGVFSDSDFMKRYLLIMESILQPLDWGVDSLEQYYNPLVTTPDWLQWIGEWFDVLIHPSLSVTRQRAVVKELGVLFRQRGTKRGLTRLLELYFGVLPQIEELDSPPATFKVILPLGTEDTPLARALATRLITTCKPAYTAFTLEII
jgi:phage tail-like protein